MKRKIYAGITASHCACVTSYLSMLKLLSVTMPFEYPISPIVNHLHKKQFLANMNEKMTDRDFIEDIRLVLKQGVEYDHRTKKMLITTVFCKNLYALPLNILPFF